jgi:acyl dehydratase
MGSVSDGFDMRWPQMVFVSDRFDLSVSVIDTAKSELGRVIDSFTIVTDIGEELQWAQNVYIQ